MKMLDFTDKTISATGLLPCFTEFMECCAVYCFESECHASGIILHVKNNLGSKEEFVLKWEKIDLSNYHSSMKDANRTTDFGAMYVSILLTIQITGCGYFVTSCKGTGIDFWLFESRPSILDFGEAKGKLEISGIRREKPNNNIEKRIKVKLQQIKKENTIKAPSYISIVEFSKPKTLFACH